MLEKSKNLTFAENEVKLLCALGASSRAQVEALANELV